MRKVLAAAMLACGMLGVAAAADGASDGTRQYVVLYEKGASAPAAEAAIRDAGGKIVDENTAIGVATVRTSDASFAADVARSKAIVGAATDSAIGHAPNDAAKVRRDAVEKPAVADTRGARPGSDRAAAGGDPLSPQQWDMQMMDATPTGSYRRQQGSHKVKVGIIDTGIDGAHPDVAPNFDARLSRNFTVDDPTIDGPCADEPDHSCQDAANVDEDGHGTHVASTIGSPLNGQGIAGVAPGVDLVNLRAGQDSGYFFLGPTLDALTYAGDHGIDVVNMSYYIDPWLYNCTANPADSPAEQREQRLVIEATQRAIDYARARGVTTISAEGNGHTDLGRPTFDDSSPDYPVDANGDPADARPRTIDNSCLLGADGGRRRHRRHLGRAERPQGVLLRLRHRAGRRRRTRRRRLRHGHRPGPPAEPHPGRLPRVGGPDRGPRRGRHAGHRRERHPDHARRRASRGGSYYQWIQGTSMASPHAVGVAALIVAEYGRRDRRHGGLTLSPDAVERKLRSSATDHACPTPRTQTYTGPTNPAQYTATCEGGTAFNGFYGDGIVNALGAVTGRR